MPARGHAFGRAVAFLAILVLSAAAIAADPSPQAAETIRLWQGDAPAARGAADHDIPTVTWWPAAPAARPSAALVICPGGGSRNNLLGDDPGEELATSLSGELAAHDAVPPLFIWHTWEDKAVPLEPILELCLRLKSLGRPLELHVYETGPHGLGLGVRPYDPGGQLHPWTVDCRRWLGSRGFE